MRMRIDKAANLTIIKENQFEERRLNLSLSYHMHIILVYSSQGNKVWDSIALHSIRNPNSGNGKICL